MSAVIRYCTDTAPPRVEQQTTPAAQLGEDEVLELRWLAAQSRFISCGECGRQMVVDVTRQQGRCHKCGSGWELTLHTSTARQASYRVVSLVCITRGSAPRDPTGRFKARWKHDDGRSNRPVR